MPPVPRPPRPALPTPGHRRATVVGAGSFGTAVAVLLARAGLRVTLQARTREQADQLAEARENATYLSGVEFPRELRVEEATAGLGRSEYVFLGVPSRGLDEVIAQLGDLGLTPRAPILSLPQGLVPPDGTPPTALLPAHHPPHPTAGLGGPPPPPG